MLTLEELARLALQTLDKQQEYFKANGESKMMLLIESKALEGQLRRACKEVVAGTKPNLFGG